MAFRYRRTVKKKRSPDSARWTQLRAQDFVAGYEGTSADVTTMDNTQISHDSTKTAAKITFDAGTRTSLQTQFELVIPEYVTVDSDTGTYLCTIDVWIDPSMREVPLGNYNTDGGGVNWKTLNSMFDISTGDGDITWEPWLNPGDGTADGMAHSGSRSYPAAVTGQTNSGGTPYEPRGLISKIYAPGPLIVPYGQWVRFVILHELNLDETHFDDWNTEIGASGPLVAGTYHRTSQWVQIGSTVYCMYWRVPMGRVVGSNTRTHLKQWGVEMDTSQDNTAASGVARFTGTEGSQVYLSFVYTEDGTRRYRIGDTISGGTGSCQGASSTTLTLKASSTFSDNDLAGKTIEITSGAGSGQRRVIVSNVGSTDVVTVSAWDVTPTAGDAYQIYNTWLISGGYVDIDVRSSMAQGTPKTAGYMANQPAGTTLTFSPGSPPSGIDSTAEVVTAISGGKDVIEANAYMWFRRMAVLRNYTLPSDPATDTLIFANDLAS